MKKNTDAKKRKKSAWHSKKQEINKIEESQALWKLQKVGKIIPQVNQLKC